MAHSTPPSRTHAPTPPVFLRRNFRRTNSAPRLQRARRRLFIENREFAALSDDDSSQSTPDRAEPPTVLSPADPTSPA